MHLPHGLDGEWIKQLVAEQLITVKTKRGFQRLEWQKMRERNEALDCRVYARAAAWIAGADRWTEAMWRDLEQQVGPPPEIEEEQPVDSGSAGGKHRRLGPPLAETSRPARVPIELPGLIHDP